MLKFMHQGNNFRIKRNFDHNISFQNICLKHVENEVNSSMIAFTLVCTGLHAPRIDPLHRAMSLTAISLLMLPHSDIDLNLNMIHM